MWFWIRNSLILFFRYSGQTFSTAEESKTSIDHFQPALYFFVSSPSAPLRYRRNERSVLKEEDNDFRRKNITRPQHRDDDDPEFIYIHITGPGVWWRGRVRVLES